jgi:hypothetical protein
VPGRLLSAGRVGAWSDFYMGIPFFCGAVAENQSHDEANFWVLDNQVFFNWYTLLFSGADLLDNHLTFDLVTMSLWFLAIQHLYWII